MLFLLQLLKQLVDLKAEVLVLNRQLLVGNPFCLQFSLALGMLQLVFLLDLSDQLGLGL